MTNWGKIYCSTWWGDISNELAAGKFPDFCKLIEANCGIQYTYTDGQAFPERYIYNLGITGTSTLTYQAYDIPDKWVIMQDGNIILDTGYRGNAALYQTILNAALAEKGLPPETIQGVGSGTAQFTISTLSPVYVFVYAPLDSTSFQTTISCPI